MPKITQQIITNATAVTGYVLAALVPVAIVIVAIGFARMIGKAVFQ